MEMNTCKLCAHAEIKTSNGTHRLTIVECPRCGHYAITDNAFLCEPLVKEGSLYLLSAAAREFWDSKSQPVGITTVNAQGLADAVVVPSNDNEYIGLILALINKRQESVSKYTQLDIECDYPAVKLTSRDDLAYYFQQAETRRLVEVLERGMWTYRVRLTSVGRTFLDNISKLPHARLDISPNLLDPDEAESIASNLDNHNKRLGDMYRQIIIDASDKSRLTWSAPFHDLRELFRRTLETLAPTEKVVAESWFKQDKDTKGPTQVQRAKYVLRARRAGGNEEAEAMKQVELIEELFGMSGRALYTRGSGNAHGDGDRNEFYRVLRYFQAVIHDLLDIRA
jgi:hypothetical protein